MSKRSDLSTIDEDDDTLNYEFTLSSTASESHSDSESDSHSSLYRRALQRQHALTRFIRLNVFYLQILPLLTW